MEAMRLETTYVTDKNNMYRYFLLHHRKKNQYKKYRCKRRKCIMYGLFQDIFSTSMHGGM